MKKYMLLMAVLCAPVYAESESLPPVIDNSSYYGDTNSTMAGAVNRPIAVSDSASAIYQVLGQLEQLQKEVRQLSGTVEEQAHELAELKKRQDTLYEDMDQRIQSIEDAKKSAETAAPALDAEPEPPAPVAAAEVVNPTAVAIAPPALDTKQRIAEQPSTVVEKTASKDALKPDITSANSVAEKNQYQEAYAKLQVGHYAEGISALNAYLSTFPNGKYAANAQYWLGEAYKASQNTDASRDAFNKVINLYPNSPKVPDALFKLGVLELDQNNLVKARDFFNQVYTGYPNTPAAQLAAKKLSALNDRL